MYDFIQARSRVRWPSRFVTLLINLPFRLRPFGFNINYLHLGFVLTLFTRSYNHFSWRSNTHPADFLPVRIVTCQGLVHINHLSSLI